MWPYNKPDVYYIIIQSLEVLSRLDTCLFHAMDIFSSLLGQRVNLR